MPAPAPNPDSVEALQNALGGMDERLGRAYEELALLHRLSRNLRVQREPIGVLQRACRDLVAAAGLRFAAITLCDDPVLGSLTGQSVSDCNDCVGDGGEDVGDRVRRAGRELLRQPPAAARESIYEPVDGAPHPTLATLARGVVVVPLRIGERCVGYLYAALLQSADPVTSAEAKLGEAVAGPVSIFLENRLLFEETQALAGGVLTSLVRAIDAKDPATRGHSERVARHAADLGRELGMPPAECERLELAGLVHDLGKIAVPEAILLKDGPLTDDEFSRIREHPQRGVDILAGLQPFADLLPAVLYHHEHWNGHGYPHGLIGGATPLHARIIGVADAFDAITSRRSYRDAASEADCLAEIERCAGTHFDPQLARRFVAMRRRLLAKPAPRLAA